MNDAVFISRAWLASMRQTKVLIGLCVPLTGTFIANCAYLFALAINSPDNFAQISTYTALWNSRGFFGASLALSLVTNTASTSVFLYQVWNLYQATANGRYSISDFIKKTRRSPTQKLLLLFVESGFAYCILQVVDLIVVMNDGTGSQVNEVASDVILTGSLVIMAMYPTLNKFIAGHQDSTSVILVRGISSELKALEGIDIERGFFHAEASARPSPHVPAVPDPETEELLPGARTAIVVGTDVEMDVIDISAAHERDALLPQESTHGFTGGSGQTFQLLSQKISPSRSQTI